MTNLDTILKRRDMTLLTKVRIVKAMVFPVVMYRCESWTIKKTEWRRIDAFELQYWRRLLRVPWTARSQTSQSQGKSTLNTHLKDWCWSWSSRTLATWCKQPIHWKRPWCWERSKAKEKRATKDEMVGWHHWLNGHEAEQTLGDSEGQGSLACCSPWVRKESDMTEWLNKKSVHEK